MNKKEACIIFKLPENHSRKEIEGRYAFLLKAAKFNEDIDVLKINEAYYVLIGVKRTFVSDEVKETRIKKGNRKSLLITIIVISLVVSAISISISRALRKPDLSISFYGKFINTRAMTPFADDIQEYLSIDYLECNTYTLITNSNSETNSVNNITFLALLDADLLDIGFFDYDTFLYALEIEDSLMELTDDILIQIGYNPLIHTLLYGANNKVYGIDLITNNFLTSVVNTSSHMIFVIGDNAPNFDTSIQAITFIIND